MDTNSVIIAARKHLIHAIQESSARLCLADAVAAYDREDLLAARAWAVKSLAYSVGIFHADYRKANSTF